MLRLLLYSTTIGILLLSTACKKQPDVEPYPVDPPTLIGVWNVEKRVSDVQVVPTPETATHTLTFDVAYYQFYYEDSTMNVIIEQPPVFYQKTDKWLLSLSGDTLGHVVDLKQTTAIVHLEDSNSLFYLYR